MPGLAYGLSFMSVRLDFLETMHVKMPRPIDIHEGRHGRKLYIHMSLVKRDSNLVIILTVEELPLTARFQRMMIDNHVREWALPCHRHFLSLQYQLLHLRC